MADYTLTSNSGSYTIIGSPSFRACILGLAVGSYALTGTDATLVYGHPLVVDPGSYTITGVDVQSHRLLAAPSNYQLQGQDVTLTREIPTPSIVADSGAYALTGDPTTVLTRSIGSERGQYLLTGTDVTLSRSDTGNTLHAVEGSYLITEGTTGLELLILIGTGDYQITGGTTDIKKGKGLVALKGTYLIAAGPAVKLLHPTRLTSAVGSYIISPSSPDTALVWGPLGNKIILAPSGPYLLTGSSVTFPTGRRLSADIGSYTLSGTDASILPTRPIAADHGIYTLTGTSTPLRHNARLVPNSGLYTVTGSTVGITFSTKSLVAESGTYALFGFAPPPNLVRVVSATPGSYSLTGSTVTLRATHISVDPGTYTLTGTPVILSTSHTGRWRKHPKQPSRGSSQPPTTPPWSPQGTSKGV